MVKCSFCGHKAIDDTPLVGVVTAVANGGKWPWAKYRLVKDEETGAAVARRPIGKYCAICLNTFNALVLDQTHASLKVFYNFVSKPEMHTFRDIYSFQCRVDYFAQRGP